MTQLKTLKDFGCDCELKEGEYCQKHKTNNTFTRELLKELAIKWIKEAIKYVDGNQHNFGILCTITEACGAIQMLKHFFNITEEDLK